MTTETVDRMRTTMQQMDRLLRALDDLRDNVLVKDPQLFAIMAEAPLDDLDRLRQEFHGYLHDITAA